MSDPETPADPFAPYRNLGRGPKRGLCLRCGEAPNGGRVAVALHERVVNESKKPGDANRFNWPIVFSTGASMCGPCCVAVHEKVLDTLEAEIGERLDRRTGGRPA